MTSTNKTALMSFVGLGLLSLLGLGSLKASPADAGSGERADASTYSVTDEATMTERDAVRDAKRDAIRDLIRDAARDAAREESPQQAAKILKQTYRQLLTRSESSADQILYGAQLMRGEKSVRAIVGSIARSPEFKEKWITPMVGDPASANAPASSKAKAVDNVYCALLGRHAAGTPVETGRDAVAAGGFDRLIKDILDSKEYAAKFGEQGIPQPSLDPRESSGCPQVS